jgi:hypothetical protein
MICAPLFSFSVKQCNEHTFWQSLQISAAPESQPRVKVTPFNGQRGVVSKLRLTCAGVSIEVNKVHYDKLRVLYALAQADHTALFDLSHFARAACAVLMRYSSLQGTHHRCGGFQVCFAWLGHCQLIILRRAVQIESGRCMFLSRSVISLGVSTIVGIQTLRCGLWGMHVNEHTRHPQVHKLIVAEGRSSTHKSSKHTGRGMYRRATLTASAGSCSSRSLPSAREGFFLQL